jgi:hypothetical protein
MTTYDIEFTDPAISRCECCGARRVRLTRFVTRNGSAFAVYYASYSNDHPEQELAMLISLGDWSDEADPSRRSAFLCRVRATDPYEVMLGDASTSLWSNVSVMGRLLTREEARAHSDKATAFAVLDEAMLRDACLKGFQASFDGALMARKPLPDLWQPRSDLHGRAKVLFRLVQNEQGFPPATIEGMWADRIDDAHYRLDTSRSMHARLPAGTSSPSSAWTVSYGSTM